MAGIVGPPPNPNRVRRNADTFSPFRTLYDDGILRGPDLPGEYDWHERTVQWWERWRCAPQAQLMRDTDWDVMLVAARIHDTIMRIQGNANAKTTDIANLSRELDRKTANYGATYADRLKLRFVIADIDPALPGDEAQEDTYYEDQLGA